MHSRWQLDGLDIAELTDLAAAALTNLAHRDFHQLRNRDRLDLLDHLERLTRTIPGIGHELVNQLGQQNAAEELQAKKLHILLTERLRITPAESKRRIAHAALLGPGVALSGHPLPAPHHPTGQAQRDGDIGADHADAILRFFNRLPADLPAEELDKAEAQLVALSKESHADHVEAAARHIEAHLHPDGDEPSDDEPIGKTHFTMKPQSRDKLTRGTFCFDAETRAYVEAYFAKTDSADAGHPLFDRVDLGIPPSAGPDAPATADGESSHPDLPSEQQDLFDFFAAARAAAATDNPAPPPTDPPAPPDGPASDGPASDGRPPDRNAATTPVDRRSRGQRRHDAIKCLLRWALGSSALGQHRGLPVTAIITTTLKELEAAAGHAVSGGGTLIPIRQAIRMAAHAHHYLLIYDDDGRPLYLGRAKRLATADQRLVLHATDRGCTFPACARPGYACQTHHTDEWADGGRTDIDRLTFACEQHHSLVGDGDHDWATTIGKSGTTYAGRTIWHPPACVDPLRRGRVNHHHHPHEYLLPPAEFPGPPEYTPKPEPPPPTSTRHRDTPRRTPE